jgi:hypothetical protein
MGKGALRGAFFLGGILMKTITFDWNCVISSENQDDQAPYVDQLINLHRKKMVEVAITTVSASETLKGSKEFPASANFFNKRLENLGWSDLPLVLGPAVIGLTYFGMCKIVGENFSTERDAIWEIVGGSTQRRLPASLSDADLHSADYKKWRNAWCDVHTLWVHIDSGRDVFISSNTKDFQNKMTQLRALGLKEVKTPEEMVASL